ncbi:uncharacterized protein [Diabrotica undecimpunctata]|uniref:uncharacterized protein isoform X2 n=1 Tax=Diabrotica undecimpunctata TaxID=50387 RepID=UPI003B63BD84
MASLSARVKLRELSRTFAPKRSGVEWEYWLVRFVFVVCICIMESTNSNIQKVSGTRLGKFFAVTKEEEDKHKKQVILQSITVMEIYRDKSFEELRYEDYKMNKKRFNYNTATFGQSSGFGWPNQLHKLSNLGHNIVTFRGSNKFEWPNQQQVFTNIGQNRLPFTNQNTATGFNGRKFVSSNKFGAQKFSCDTRKKNNLHFGQKSTTSTCGGHTTSFGINPINSSRIKPDTSDFTTDKPTKLCTDGESVRLLSESSNGKSKDLLNNTSRHPIEAFGSNNDTVNNESIVKPQLSEWLSNSDVLITSIDLPTENLSRLLCIRCHKVLSRFPVFCSAEGFSCGRCPYPKNCIRNEIYELLAQKLKFPCCYKDRGCSENLFPKQVEQHESTCKFKKYLCPMNLTTACEWKGFSTELLEHYSQCHQMFIMQNAELFGVTFFSSKDENFLLSHKDNLYLINLAIDSQKNTFSCTVSYIRHNSDKGYNYYYKLIFQNKNKPCYEIQNPINVTTRVKLEDLVQSNSINSCNMGFGKIEIFKGEKMSKKHRKGEESNTNLDYDILQELECMICCEYMLPPIYQCLTGHSICEECKESIKECPICRKDFQNTKNFALAQIIEHLNYPCKYNGCKFVTKSKDIRKHQTTCIYSPTNCQLKEHFDYFEETYVGEVYGHIVKNHDYILHINCSEKSGTPKSIVRSCFLVIYESKIFKLLSLYANNKLCFTAQFMEPYYESSSYRFDIDILDKEKKSVLRRTNSCSRMTDSKTAFDDDMAVIMFTHNEIQNFIGDQIFFKVKIFKT